jgi:A/G-specific adenine glycosylase
VKTSPKNLNKKRGQTDFPSQIVQWYEANRRDLPWRRTGDPYAVWVSEMMLQQTQVSTVIPYWTRWMERFPTVTALAEAPLEDVLKQWQGLGYYARARNMHRAAKALTERYGGRFPESFAEVLALPGIGRYTAGAVCSIAFGQDVPLVDANVIRVLCRHFGIPGDPKSAAVQEQLWTLAQDLLPAGNASVFNQGLMELGALVCQSKPRCDACPVQASCAAFTTGNPERFPESAPRPVFTTQTDVSAIIRHPGGDGRVLIVRRPAGGLWGGLWEFPRCTRAAGETLADAARRAAREAVDLAVRSEGAVVGTIRHGVTTRKITLVGIACEAEEGDGAARPPDGGACAWVTPDEAERFALSSPQVRLLAHVRTAVTQPTLF